MSEDLQINNCKHGKWWDGKLCSNSTHGMTGMHHFMGGITPSFTWRYFDDTRVFTCCRYWSPWQRAHTCSNSCSSISAPSFVVIPVSGRLISHIVMSSIPASVHSFTSTSTSITETTQSISRTQAQGLFNLNCIWYTKYSVLEKINAKIQNSLTVTNFCWNYTSF